MYILTKNLGDKLNFETFVNRLSNRLWRKAFRVMIFYLQALPQVLRNRIKTLQKDSAMDVYPFVKKVSKIKTYRINHLIIPIDKNFPTVQRKTYPRSKENDLFVNHFF